MAEGEGVATADATLRAHEAGAFQCEEDLFEIGLWQPRALGDVADRRRTGVIGVQGKGEKGATRIVTPCRYAHEPIVGKRR